MNVPTGVDIGRWVVSGLALLALATTARANLALAYAGTAYGGTAYAGTGAATDRRGARSTR